MGFLNSCEEAIVADENREFQLLYDAELAKLKTHTDTLPESHKQLMQPTLENLAWMKAKLDETRELFGRAQVVLKVEGSLKKNPGFEAYAQLLDRYMRAMKQLLEIIATVKSAPEGKGTTLDEIQNRRKNRKPTSNKKRRS